MSQFNLVEFAVDYGREVQNQKHGDRRWFPWYDSWQLTANHRPSDLADVPSPRTAAWVQPRMEQRFLISDNPAKNQFRNNPLDIDSYDHLNQI